jgi:hypothetical protein
MANQAFCGAQHAMTPVPMTCKWCGEPEHLAEECLGMYDVHYVTLDNREDWIGCLLEGEYHSHRSSDRDSRNSV